MVDGGIARIEWIDHDGFREFLCAPEACAEDYMEASLRTREQCGTTRARLWSLPPDLQLAGAGLVRIAEHTRSLGLDARIAVWAESDLAYGLARLHFAWREEGKSRLGLFRDREAAVAFLQEADPQEAVNSTS